MTPFDRSDRGEAGRSMAVTGCPSVGRIPAGIAAIALVAAFVLGLAAPAQADAPLPVPKPAIALQSAPGEHPHRAARTATAAPARIDIAPPRGVSGWLVVDLATGRVVDEARADRGFAPASVAKLPTAAFALDMFGPAHRFETRLLATGPVRNGAIAGDLVLQGGGDPELDTDALVPLALGLQRAGVRSISGAFVADGSALPQVSQITPGQKVDAAFNPSVSGLNLNFNRVRVKWDARKGDKGLRVEAMAARLSPETDAIRVVLAGAPDAPLFAFHRQDGREVWQMARRAYRGQAARWLPVKAPETYAAEVLRAIGAQHGVTLPRPVPGVAPPGAGVLGMTQSRPLGEILRDMLTYSTNLTAEVVGSGASRAAGTDARTLAQSADVMNAWAAGVAGFPAGDAGFRLVNHSGLTLQSRVSPRRLVQLLVALARRAEMPEAGLPFGIARYLDIHPVADAPPGLLLAAKTGTMSYVRGLAGYIVTPEGRRLAFAVFSNDLASRGEGPERVDHRWLARATAFEQALIRSWVAQVDGG